MSHTLRIENIDKVTHDVRSYRMHKPDGYTFTPGQATEVAIAKNDWREEKRPLTFTSLPEDDYLEFTIKSYPSHNGVTEQIDQLEVGDHFILDDPWGAIEYNGPGVFIAGGAGVTPFISIFRDLATKGKIAGNRLIFSNKTEQDIILQDEFRKLLGDQFTTVLTEKEHGDHHYGRIDKNFLENEISDFSQHFYVCGPDAMVKDISSKLEELGANTDSIVFEK